ncbi:hypothetical protein KR009_004551 [Drosophila setifemur]|nr:hypothetical protein KR009_004551 [Drosophila setifemur]
MPYMDDSDVGILEEPKSCLDNPEGLTPRWWFGGVASSMVASVVAPIDILKTHMQTQHHRRNMFNTARKIIRIRGFVGFYDGFSAAVLRQMTCTNIRFSVYETFRQAKIVQDNSYLGKLTLGLLAGACGSICGIPADLVNVRMQTDMKYPPQKRRNYKHVIDALVRIPREEGFFALYKGGSVALLKASVGTCSQIASYDIIKTEMRKRLDMNDQWPLHFLSSLVTSVSSSILTHPLDVLKTVMMNAMPGEMISLSQAARHMMRFGLIGPFRGLLPTMVRKGPATILLFVLYEQLRLHFGKCTLGGEKKKLK